MTICSIGRTALIRGDLHHKSSCFCGCGVVLAAFVRTAGAFDGGALAALEGGSTPPADFDGGADFKLVVAAQPTRGVDVGSIEYIHKQLIACRDAGNAVVVISSELDEIINLSDRIYVMFDGRISGEFDNRTGQADRQLIGLAMAGAGKDVAA